MNGDCAVSEIRMKDGRLYFTCKDEILLSNEVNVADLVYVAAMVKNETIMED